MRLLNRVTGFESIKDCAAWPVPLHDNADSEIARVSILF